MAPIRFQTILSYAVRWFVVRLLQELANQLAMYLVKVFLAPAIHHMITMILIALR